MSAKKLSSSFKEEKEEGGKKKLIISAVFFILALLFQHLSLLKIVDTKLNSFIPSFPFSPSSLICTLFFLASYLLTAKEVLIKAVKNIKKGRVFDECFLMSISSLGAIILGEVGEACGIMLLYNIGEAFQDNATNKTKEAIKALLTLTNKRATVLKEGKYIEIESDKLKVGDIIIVKMGERILGDGVIIEGKTYLDNSILTGESIPIEALKGSEVYAGSINTGEAIKVKITKDPQESTTARIIKLVEKAEERKAKIDKTVTVFSRVYTPIVCILTLLVAMLPPLILTFLQKGSFNQEAINATYQLWIHRALMLLVVSCPCAVVISVPLTLFCAIKNACLNGVLIKGSDSMEAISKVKTILFDKTGTLTYGVFNIEETHTALDNLEVDTLIMIATHAETLSQHPAALSLKAYHRCDKCATTIIESAKELPGRGVKVKIEGKEVLVGNELLMTAEGVKVTPSFASGKENSLGIIERIKEASSFKFYKCDKDDRGTLLHVAINKVYLGHIIIRDKVKIEAKEAIKELKSLGIKDAVMLSGDNKIEAERVGALLSLDKIYSKLTPEDKLNIVESYIKNKKDKKSLVAFVGDGINDSPSLARADLGIAMGGLGQDASVEAASVVIMNDNLLKLPYIIRLGKACRRIIKENIIFTLLAKLSVISLSIAGISNMWVAVFADSGLTILTVLNALRAKVRVKKRKS